MAELADLPHLLEFNQAMAEETEGRSLDPSTLRQGLDRLLQSPQMGFYLVAQSASSAVGCLMVTSEWSDWRNGLFWWIQSVYVRPTYRRQGVFRSLFEFVRQRARQHPDVCGLRLYVERDNGNAQACYRTLGMSETAYRMYELTFASHA